MNAPSKEAATAASNGQKETDTSPSVQPVSVTFTGQAAAQLQELAVRKRTDVGSIVQSTLALGQAIDAALDDGASVVIKRRGNVPDQVLTRDKSQA